MEDSLCWESTEAGSVPVSKILSAWALNRYLLSLGRTILTPLVGLHEPAWSL
jgi:hypothetical protein